ncbi:NAD(P)-binding protein [Embleya sp. NPDC050493]|uniref:NAD(P)-binding protein n=1 Tax=Embleya sp. NPDC050493 TaxID=3363989 RepID=UPI003790FF1E
MSRYTHTNHTDHGDDGDQGNADANLARPTGAGGRNDDELGMKRRISRRDFLDGVAIAATAAAVPTVLAGSAAAAPAGPPSDTGPARPDGRPAGYPPALTGMRGSQDGSFEIAHALRDGTFWEKAGRPIDTGEEFDLVVVGAGISGLSAAHFHLRDVDPHARILVLDPHDDFGGHARRNEFRVRGETLIGYGGSQSIEFPSTYPPEASRLLTDIGIDLDRFDDWFDKDFYRNHGTARRATFWAKEDWGRDHLVVGGRGTSMAAQLADAPLDPAAKAPLAALFDAPRDYLAGLTHDRKIARLAGLSYGSYLTDVAGLTGDAYRYLRRLPAAGTGANSDQFSALDAAAQSYPGTSGLGLDFANGPWPGLSKTMNRFWGAQDPYIFHFPDGNATVARALVRRLIPSALPGRTIEDLVTSRCDYGQLDHGHPRRRIRLNSTVVRARHRPGNRRVDVAYVRNGRLEQVTARSVVLACWNNLIPYIAPDFTPAQHAAGHQAVKYPLLYATVALRDWRAFQRLGANSIGFVDNYWNGASLDFPVSIGKYRFSRGPSEPILLHLDTGLTVPGMSAQAGAKAARGRLMRTTFEDLERGIRDLLARALGPSGFDPARDIAGLTVNRWAHGYARYYGLPFDAAFWPHGPTPADIVGTPVGRITVATTDQAHHGFVDGAIETAYRAVRYLGGSA